MAWIVCEVDSLEDVGKESSEYREIEGILFRDETGRERKFYVKAIINQFTSYMRKIYPDIDWDENNIHIAILLGNEIKEVK